MAYLEKREHVDKKTNKKVVRHRAMIRLKGQPTQCATFDNITEAKRWVQQTEASIREGRYFKTAEAKKHKVGQLIDKYLREVLPNKPRSEQKQTMQLNWWKSKIGSYLLADVTPMMITDCREELLQGVTYRGTKRSPATVVRYLAALSHVFSVAVNEYGWMDVNPLSKVSKPKESRGRVRFLDDDERKRLLEACKESSNPYLYMIVVVALSTGMRQMEILTLKWRDVDLSSGRLTIHETKNGERRVVSIAGHGLELLRVHFQNRKVLSEFLFPGRDPSKPLDVRSPWANAIKLVDIKDFKFHDLRHSAASYLAMNKASLTEIAAILGHKTLSMVKRYSHLSDAHITGVIGSMNDKIFG